jgi:hypothetical protein
MSGNWSLIGDDNGVDIALPLDSGLFKRGACIPSDDRSKAGNPACSKATSCSSRRRAMTEPEPFLGPRFFLAMSLVHVRRLWVHLGEDVRSVLSYYQ